MKCENDCGRVATHIAAMTEEVGISVNATRDQTSIYFLCEACATSDGDVSAMRLISEIAATRSEVA